VVRGRLDSQSFLVLAKSLLSLDADGGQSLGTLQVHHIMLSKRFIGPILELG